MSTGGIVNAASFLAASSPGGALAQGSIFTIFGGGIGPSPGVVAERFPLGTTLGGAAVQIVHQSGQSLAAFPIFVSANQINAILPSAMSVGLVTVTVTYNGRTSVPVTAKVVRSSFGAFSPNGAQNYESPESLPLNSPAKPARPGQTVILWGTGLGPIALPDQAGPAPGNRTDPIRLLLAGRPVPVDYAGRSGCCAGVDQIQFRIPEDAPAGCVVPVQVELQNGVYSSLTSISVTGDGGPCAGATARRWAQIDLFSDSVNGMFFEAEAPPRFSLPGACAASGAGGLIARPLDAGPALTLNGTTSIPGGPPGFYNRSNLPLGPVNHTIEGPGGADVGPFRASVAASPGFSLTGVSGSRSAGLTVSWAGAAEQVAISSGSFSCLASGSAGTFTVPAPVLANLPAQLPVEVASVYQATFTARGLDAGLLRYSAVATRVATLGEPPLAATPVRLPDGRSILAELALTGPEQQRGLMQRADLGPDRGMLFLFDQSRPLTFWMFGTLIPLDILFLDSGRRIIFVSANTPPCRSTDAAACPLYGPRDPAQFVLEIAGGRAAQLGLRIGDRLDW